ncbi:hypothetical protein MASR2M117_23210 [Paludibacter sp.]
MQDFQNESNYMNKFTLKILLTNICKQKQINIYFNNYLMIFFVNERYSSKLLYIRTEDPLGFEI